MNNNQATRIEVKNWIWIYLLEEEKSATREQASFSGVVDQHIMNSSFLCAFIWLYFEFLFCFFVWEFCCGVELLRFWERIYSRMDKKE